MPDDSITEWIKSRETQGYTDVQIKVALIQSGYSKHDVDEAYDIMNSAGKRKGFFKSVSEKGHFFTFFFLLNLCVTILVISVGIAAAVYFSIIPAAFTPAIYLLILLILCFKSKLYAVLLLTVEIIPIWQILFLIFPVGRTITDVPNITLYIMLALVSLLAGLYFSFLFDKTSKSNGPLILSGILLSFVVSTASIANAILLQVLDKFLSADQTTVDIQAISRGAISLFQTSTVLDTYVMFGITMLFFNLPFLYAFSQRDDKKWVYVLLYLLPIVFFFGTLKIIENLIFLATTMF